MKFSKGDLIQGLFNRTYDKTYDDKYCAVIINSNNKQEYIKFDDICEYEIKLFPLLKNNNILDNIDVIEKLSNNSNIFTVFTLLHYLKSNNYDFLIINQKLLISLFTNNNSKYSIKYMEGIYINNKLIPIYLLPNNNLSTYLIKGTINNIQSYIKLKY